MHIEQLVVAQGGERLDLYLTAQLGDVTRSQITKWIAAGLVTVNDKAVKAGYRLSVGDTIQILRPLAPIAQLEPLPIPLEVLYQDADCLIVNKPAGLVVHPAAGHHQDTLVNILIARYPELIPLFESAEGGHRRGIVHRLDRDTSGLLMVARHEDAWRALQAQFKARQVSKTYLALLYGRMKEATGQVDAPLGRDPRNRKRMAVVAEGRRALTEYRVREFLYDARGEYTLVEVHLYTGRTHQIRVHMAYINHPVVGDSVYGRRKPSLACPRQFLHAHRLGFRRLSDGQWIEVESPLPDDLQKVLDGLKTG